MASIKKIIKPTQLLTALSFALVMVGCQTLPKTVATNTTPTINAPIKFNISGKIGITTALPDGNQSNTAFYAWAQEGERFAIDLTGALGIGATTINFDGKTATLHNESTGSIKADSPEELLLQATGWQAPISQLPYWVVGRAAPSDKSHQHNELGQLTQATNDEWTATFEYKGNLPNRLRITHTDGHRIIMSIVHGN